MLRKLFKCICIEIFDNFFIGQYERPLKTEKKAFCRLLISVSTLIGNNSLTPAGYKNDHCRERMTILAK